MQMTESALFSLDDVCRELDVPLLCARSYGLVGYLRVRPEHPWRRHACTCFFLHAGVSPGHVGT